MGIEIGVRDERAIVVAFGVDDLGPPDVPRVNAAGEGDLSARPGEEKCR